MAARRPRPASVYRRWHRFLAIAGALFIIFLVATGSAVNHGDFLGLDQQRVERPWLLGWYGLRDPGNLRTFVAAGKTLTWAGNLLYLDGVEIASTRGVAIGAVSSNELLIAASGEGLLLFSPVGELVEQLTVSQPGFKNIDAIGVNRSNRVVLRSGSQMLLADQQLLAWQPMADSGSSIQWSSEVATPAAIGKIVVRSYQGPGLSLEQLLLDLHSGRFFGPLGILIYDLLAIGLLTLAVSGLILWQRGRRNNRRNDSK